MSVDSQYTQGIVVYGIIFIILSYPCNSHWQTESNSFKKSNRNNNYFLFCL